MSWAQPGDKTYMVGMIGAQGEQRVYLEACGTYAYGEWRYRAAAVRGLVKN